MTCTQSRIQATAEMRLMTFAMSIFILGIMLGCDDKPEGLKSYERFAERSEEYIAEYDSLFRKLEAVGGRIFVHATGEKCDQIAVSIDFKGSEDVDSSVLETIAEIKEVDMLRLSGIHIVDEDIKKLKELPMLKLVVADDTAIGDPSLNYLAALPKLEILSLDRTRISDAGMSTINRMRKLEILSLSGTGITDAGLEQIKELKRLKRLRLSGTAITDAGLRHFEGLSELEDLYLEQTNVSEDAVERLKKSLPDCEMVTEVEPIEQL